MKGYYSQSFAPTPAARVADALNALDMRIKAIACGTAMVRVRDLRRDSPLPPGRNPLHFVALAAEDAARLYALDLPNTAGEC